MKKKHSKIVLLRDIIIPAGTVMEEGPVKREWGEKCYEEIVEVHKDGVAYFTLGVTDAKLRPDIFRIE